MSVMDLPALGFNRAVNLVRILIWTNEGWISHVTMLKGGIDNDRVS